MSKEKALHGSYTQWFRETDVRADSGRPEGCHGEAVCHAAAEGDGGAWNRLNIMREYVGVGGTYLLGQNSARNLIQRLVRSGGIALP